ncbi:MAG: hypothetical protein HY722_16765 [Planctomycetes bacterium]|nr:hypothetical protein [Planctomycetota bacterium]
MGARAHCCPRCDGALAREDRRCGECGFDITVFADRGRAMAIHRSLKGRPGILIEKPVESPFGWLVAHAQLLLV